MTHPGYQVPATASGSEPASWRLQPQQVLTRYRSGNISNSGDGGVISAVFGQPHCGTLTTPNAPTQTAETGTAEREGPNTGPMSALNLTNKEPIRMQVFTEEQTHPM